MKTTIFVVDDDVKFLESLSTIVIDDAVLLTFTDPLDAIKAYGSHRPDIIVSDVQMPGIHGLAFSVIVRELMKPRLFAYISANSIMDIERRFGPIAPHRLFRKPLDEEFLDFLETSASSLTPKIEPPSAFEARPSRELTPANLEKLHLAWRKLNDFEYDSFLKAELTVARHDEYHDTVESLERDLKLICEVLDVSAESQKSLFDEFSKQHADFGERLTKRVEELLLTARFDVSEPMNIDLSMIGGSVTTLSCVELRRTERGVRLFCDGTEKEPDKAFWFREGLCTRPWRDELRAVGMFKSLESMMRQRAFSPVRELFYGHGTRAGSRPTGERKAIVRVPTDALSGVRGDTVYVSFGGSSAGTQLSCDVAGQRVAVTSAHLPHTLPSEFSISESRHLVAKSTNLEEYSCTLDGRALRVPIAEIVNDELSRGFKANDDVYFRKKALVGFLWDVALGRTTWRFCGQTIDLRDLVL